MDHVSSRQLIARIEEYKEAGVTIIVTTHNREVTGRLADRVVVLSDGRMVASGPYQEVMSSQDPVLLPVLQDLV